MNVVRKSYVPRENSRHTHNYQIFIMIAQQLAPVLAFVTQLLSTAAAVSRIGAVPALIAKVPGAWCRSSNFAKFRLPVSHLPRSPFAAVNVLLYGHCLSVAGMSKTNGGLSSYVLVCRRNSVTPFDASARRVCPTPGSMRDLILFYADKCVYPQVSGREAGKSHLANELI